MVRSGYFQPQGRIGIHRLRVRYAETDQMGVAHHGAFIPWIAEARTEWIRETGTTYRSLEESGRLLTVTRVSVRYRAPARYDDLLEIATWLRELHKASITLAYRITLARREEEEESAGLLIAEAETCLCWIDADRRPRRIPPGLFD